MEFEVIVYWLDGNWKCWNLQDPEKKFILDKLGVNKILAASTFIGKTLSLLKSSNTNELFHYSEEVFAKLTLYVSHFCFFNLNKIYVPINSLSQPSIDLHRDYLIPEVEERYNIMTQYLCTNSSNDFISYLNSFVLDSTSFTYFLHPDYVFLLLEDYEPWPGIEEGLYGGFFKQGTEKWNFYYCPRGQFPTDEVLASVKGMVITGGRNSANDDLAWISHLGELMIKADQLGIKNVSFCLAHQIAAKFFGGSAGNNPTKEYFYNISEIYKSTIMEGLPSTLNIAESHADCVTELPTRGEVLYSSQDCVVEVMKIGENFIGFQGHPEFTTHFMRYFHSINEKKVGKINQQEYELFIRSCEKVSDSEDIIDYLNQFLRNH